MGASYQQPLDGSTPRMLSQDKTDLSEDRANHTQSWFERRFMEVKLWLFSRGSQFSFFTILFLAAVCTPRPSVYLASDFFLLFLSFLFFLPAVIRLHEFFLLLCVLYSVRFQTPFLILLALLVDISLCPCGSSSLLL